MKRLLPLLVASLLSLPLVACGADAESRAAQRGEGDAPREVRVVEARAVALPDVVPGAGTLGAEEQVELALKVAGKLADVGVDLGSRVGRGQVLARLIPTDHALRVGQAEAALAQARARLGIEGDGGGAVQPEETGVVKRAQAVLV